MRLASILCALCLGACYSATAIDGEEDADPGVRDAAAESDVAPPRDTGPEPDVTPVGPGSVRCWTVAPADDQLVLVEVDMDTGACSEVGRYGSAIASSFHTAGMAYLDGKLIMSAYDGSDFILHELDLATGGVRRSTIAIEMHEGIGSDDVEIVAPCSLDALCFFRDFDAIATGAPARRVPGFFHASRFTLHAGEVYGAWHSTDTVGVYDAHTGAALRSVLLEDYDTWVWGLSVAGGRLHLIDDGRRDDDSRGVRIAAFDPMTGELLAEAFVPSSTSSYSHRPSGLWCESPGPSLP